MSRIEIEGKLLFIPIRTEQADAQPQIERQVTGDVPVILEVRLQNFVAVVILEPSVLLPETGNSSQQQVGERISGGERPRIVGGVKG